MDWKEFENLIAKIFELNDFKVEKKVIFKDGKRHEIDLVATRFDKIFCVDCKYWGMGRYKKTSLKKAAEKQVERCLKLKEVRKLKQPVYSVIVTLHEEDLIFYGKTVFVPLSKLNSFLNEFEMYEVEPV